MKKLSLILTVFIVGCSTNQIGLTSVKDIFDAPKINSTSSEITVEDFKSHISYLASDGLGGRAAGTRGDKKAKDYIVRHFKYAGNAERSVEVQEHFVPKSRLNPKKTVKTYNIIATLPGNDEKLKNEYVVIGGHYDTTANKMGLINNGADDNASGTSMVMELFEKFASSNNHKRTLVFMAFGGEELGLLGSRHYVNNPTINLENVQLMVNLDMVGRMDEENNVELGGSPSAKDFSSKLNPFLASSPLNIKELGKGIFSRSDHYNFYRKNIPVLFFFTGIHKDYHTPTDDEFKINYNGMMEISKVVENIIDEFANVDERLIFENMDGDQQEMQTPARMKVTLGVMPDYSYSGKGLRIEAVIENRTAAKAGMKDGDVVFQIGETKVKDIYKYMEILSKIEPGSTVPVIILRDNEEETLDVTF